MGSIESPVVAPTVIARDDDVLAFADCQVGGGPGIDAIAAKECCRAFIPSLLHRNITIEIHAGEFELISLFS
jgi:hypothetical protein